MNCPKCGKKINGNQNFCANCGESLQMQNFEKIKKEGQIAAPVKIILLIFVAITALTTLLLNSKTLNIDPKETQSTIFSKAKALSCEAYEVKFLAINIYKENDYFYKFIDENSIDNITLEVPMVTNYDDVADKYECKGVVTLKSQFGFKPKEYNLENEFYNKINSNQVTQDGVKVLDKIIEIKCLVKYTSELIEDKTVVQSSFCTNNLTSNENQTPEFVYDEIKSYFEIPGEREKLEKALEEQKYSLQGIKEEN